MDLLGLTGKVAIVTGGASGIGEGVVKYFSDLKMKIVIADLDEELGTELERELSNQGKEIMFFEVDISNKNQVKNLIEATVLKYGTIDILVNSAGVSGLSNYLEIIEEEFDWHININIKGTHLMCLEVAKLMVEKGIKGRIVNISSINDQIPVAGLAPYATSKAAISGLTKSIALELAPYGINVNAIRPGAIETPMTKEILDLPDLAQALIRQIPRGRFGQPEDIAKVITFLVSDLSEWVTGAIIPVAGGMQLVGETSYNYYFEREMRHEENLPDIPFTRPWKKFDISKYKKKRED